MKPQTWVVGSGGMLGSAVVRRLRFDDAVEVCPGPSVGWGEPTALSDLVDGLGQLLDAASDAPWQILWCAGAGVTASNEEDMMKEFLLFRDFLARIAMLSSEQRNRGGIFLASSAGAVYGGSAHPPFDENTIPIPLGAYGHAKLRIERALTNFSALSGVPVLIGRIANLYGPGQALEKQQGIVSQLCKSSLLGQPISMFVSLDTRRDYIYVDDCALLVTRGCMRLGDRPSGSAPVVKILASGRSVTLASVLGEFRHVVGRRPKVVTGSSPHAGLQGRDLRVRSVRWVDLDRTAKTPLVVGISRTLADLSLKLNESGARAMQRSR